MFPSAIAPPISTIRAGSIPRSSACATLVSGPSGTSVVSGVTCSTRNPTAFWATGSEARWGSSGPSRPLSPWTCAATWSSRVSGRSAPAATGTSSRPTSASTFSALSVVFSSVWFPCTVVTPTSSTSGLASASRSAIASSWPGSQSMMSLVTARVSRLARPPSAGKAARRSGRRRSPRPRRPGAAPRRARGPRAVQTSRQAVNASPAAVPSTASTAGGSARATSSPSSSSTAPSAPSVTATRPSRRRSASSS